MPKYAVVTLFCLSLAWLCAGTLHAADTRTDPLPPFAILLEIPQVTDGLKSTAPKPTSKGGTTIGTAAATTNVDNTGLNGIFITNLAFSATLPINETGNTKTATGPAKISTVVIDLPDEMTDLLTKLTDRMTSAKGTEKIPTIHAFYLDTALKKYLTLTLQNVLVANLEVVSDPNGLHTRLSLAPEQIQFSKP